MAFFRFVVGLFVFVKIRRSKGVQRSCFPETINDIHSCVDSWPEHFRVVCDLESSLRLGHVHLNRLSSTSHCSTQNSTNAGHSDSH